jgi:mono/diheme cytochrome c family protein
MPKRRSIQLLLAGVAAAALWAGDSQAKDSRLEAGERDYRALCASCHGPEARGDGPVAAALDPRPPDLTGIAKRRDGVFPVPTVTRMVDGRDPVVAHGTRSMPVWGEHFAEGTEAREGFGYARGRIQLIVEYLKSIQQPPLGQSDG